MRNIYIIILPFLFSSCFDNHIEFNKEYYEKTTGIKFPENYTVLETFDNFEFLTGTVFQMDSLTLLNFINENHFDSVTDHWSTRLMGDIYLKNKPVFSSTKNLYVKNNSNQRTGWTYIADLNSKRLWTEINYPDWRGK